VNADVAEIFFLNMGGNSMIKAARIAIGGGVSEGRKRFELTTKRTAQIRKASYDKEREFPGLSDNHNSKRVCEG
jgi:hypothetical protein